MKDLATATGAGLLVGAVFALVRQPPPAPSTLAGVLGVAGIAAGWAATHYLLNRG